MEDIVQSCLLSLLTNDNVCPNTVYNRLKSKTQKEKDFFSDACSMEELQDSSSCCLTMEDYTDSLLAGDILKEELDKTRTSVISKQKSKLQRNKELIYKFIIEGEDCSSLSEEYGISTNNINEILRNYKEYLATEYYDYYYRIAPNALSQIKREYFNGEFTTSKKGALVPKYLSAVFPACSSATSNGKRVYENICYVEERVYQKRITRIG